MKNTVSHHEFLMEFLANPKKAAAYLSAAAEQGSIRCILKALRNVIEAQGGFTSLAHKVHMSRTSLYKAFSETGNPEISTFESVLKAYGIRIGFFSDTKQHRRAA